MRKTIASAFCEFCEKLNHDKRYSYEDLRKAFTHGFWAGEKKSLKKKKK